jgi:hypothetical protein
MNQEALDRIMDRWEGDPDFRAHLQADPQAAAAEAGITLADDELEVLRQVDWSASNLELAPRVSKVSPP